MLLTGITEHFVLCSLDKEPPVIYCPKNQEVQKKGDDITVKVYWPSPTYRDNSGKPVAISTESINGSNYRIGSYVITYEARDDAGNKATCTFVIVVSGKGIGDIQLARFFFFFFFF